MANTDVGKDRPETEDYEIKVTDRRKYRLDGQLRETQGAEQEEPQEPDERTEDEPRRHEELHVEGTATVASPGPGTGFQRHPVQEPEGVDFTMLINAMAQPALIFLGEVPHPGTGQPEVNLEQARLQIDLLDTLRIKTRGNLNPQEEGLLDRMLYQLRMLYVTRSGKAGSET